MPLGPGGALLHRAHSDALSPWATLAFRLIDMLTLCVTPKYMHFCLTSFVWLVAFVHAAHKNRYLE